MTLGALTTLRMRRVLPIAWLTLLLATLVAACGGGTSQFEPFQPGRLLAFGDETSLLTADGRKYGVNALNATDVLDCTLDPIWVQMMASQYAFVFAECNPNASAETMALMRAEAGAKVDDFTRQIDRQLASGGFAAKDLATVLVGANDVLELYADFPATRSEEQITAELRARGERLAAQVNRLVSLDVRVVVSTVPDLGLTPFAVAQKAAYTDTDRAALLSRLTAAFNSRLRVNILNDGRFVGLVLADELVQSLVRAPEFFGLTNTVAAVCTVAPPDCTSKTVVASGTSINHLWASDRHLTYAGQQRLGTTALQRATGNPF